MKNLLFGKNIRPPANAPGVKNKIEQVETSRRTEILLLLTQRPRRLDWLMGRYKLSRHSIIRDISILRRGRVIDTVQAGRLTWYELVD